MLRGVAIVMNAVLLITALLIISGQWAPRRDESWIVFTILIITPTIDLMYIYATRFSNLNGMTAKIKDKKQGLIGLWVQRKTLEEKQKIKSLSKD